MGCLLKTAVYALSDPSICGTESSLNHNDFSNSKGTKIGVKNRLVREIGWATAMFDSEVENDSWFELSGGSEKREFEKSSCHSQCKSHFKHFQNFEKESQLSV